MIALSFSRAELARHCKFAFNQRHILKTPEAESAALQGGGLFHDWAEQYGSIYLSNKIPDMEWARNLTAEMPDGIPYEVYSDIQGLFLRWAERTVLEFPDKMRFEARLAFNQNWEPVEWEAEDVFLRMVIDRIDFMSDPTRIVDYKTARALQEAKKLQQRTYAFGANLALGDKRQDFQVVEEFVRFGVFREEVLTYDEYGNVGDYYLKLAREIEKWTVDELMQPTVSSWCGLCGYQGICPKYKEEIVDTDLDVRGPEDAAKLAEKVYMDEARNKVAKEVLKVFAETHGAIVFGDQEYGPRISDKLSWHSPMDALSTLRDIHQIDGATLDKIAKLDKKKLEKFFKDTYGADDVEAKLAEMVGSYGTTKPEQKFTFHKVKEEG